LSASSSSIWPAIERVSAGDCEPTNFSPCVEQVFRVFPALQVRDRVVIRLRRELPLLRIYCIAETNVLVCRNAASKIAGIAASGARWRIAAAALLRRRPNAGSSLGISMKPMAAHGARSLGPADGWPARRQPVGAQEVDGLAPLLEFGLVFGSMWLDGSNATRWVRICEVPSAFLIAT
jgi:hypothetical protein